MNEWITLFIFGYLKTIPANNYQMQMNNLESNPDLESEWVISHKFKALWMATKRLNKSNPLLIKEMIMFFF